MRRNPWPGRVLFLPLVVLGIFSIHALDGFLPPCSFRSMTGYFCPGCGATRATKALADFRVDEAFRQNAFFTTAVLVGLPLVFLGAAREKFPEVSWLRPFRWRKNFFWFFLAALLLFTALRNLPGFVVLAPK